MPRADIGDCILTSPPSEPGCKVVLFVVRMPYILYCELGDEEWTELCYYDELKRTIDLARILEESMPNLLISPVCCDGNLYAVWSPLGDCEHGRGHYNKSDFFQGSKPLKKVLKNLEKSYFKSSINP